MTTPDLAPDDAASLRDRIDAVLVDVPDDSGSAAAEAGRRRLQRDADDW